MQRWNSFLTIQCKFSGALPHHVFICLTKLQKSCAILTLRINSLYYTEGEPRTAACLMMLFFPSPISHFFSGFLLPSQLWQPLSNFYWLPFATFAQFVLQRRCKRSLHNLELSSGGQSHYCSKQLIRRWRRRSLFFMHANQIGRQRPRWPFSQA